MPDQFHHKHIHSTVWLIIILLVVIIVAAVIVVQVTNNAPVGTLVPEVPAAPVQTGPPDSSQSPASSVTTSQLSAVDGTEAGQANLQAPDSVKVGDEVEVVVTMDTDQRNINSARVTLIYDPAQLQFEEFVKDDSVMPMSFRDETIDNLVIVERGILGDADPADSDDGYTGSDGIFGSFRFTALQAGQAAISLGFHGTIYYLDDGLGSKIYPFVDQATININ